jgi:hypothetical protein
MGSYETQRGVGSGALVLCAALVGAVTAGCASSDTNDLYSDEPDAAEAPESAPIERANDSGAAPRVDGLAPAPEGDGSANSTDSATGSDAPTGCTTGPQTSVHYAAGWSGDSPGSTLGFNLADVSSASEASALPAGFQALVWLGLCNGADATFISTVQPFVGNAKVYGFYLMDEPDPTGQYAPPACSPANLKAEADWIHANVPGTKTFIVMMNLGTDSAPSYDASYNPANTDIDLYGLDPYPCQSANNGCDYTELASSVAAAKQWGIPEVAIIPVYQAFGGGGYAQWTLPTAAQTQTILTAWASLVPRPAFDYVYAWGSQQSDTALSQSPDLQAVFAAHNQSSCLAQGD